MTKHNDLWKPQPGDVIAPKKIKRIKKPTRAEARKKRHQETKRQKKEARLYCLKHFGLYKYATDAAVAYCISQECDKPMPDVDKGNSKYILLYWLARTDQKPSIKKRYLTSEEFYSSKKWKEVRYIAMANSEGRCNLCGASPKDGVKLHVDHIDPRSKAPNKAYDLDNLQVLCEDCNMGKSNYDSIDWR